MLNLESNWPKSENVRYVALIVPVKINEEVEHGHAVLVLFDQKLQTIECIDPLGSDTKNVDQAKELLKLISQPVTEDLDDEDVEDLKIIKRLAVFADKLRSYRVITPPEKAPAQQVDATSCVLQTVANIVGIVLKKENKVPDQKSDPKVKSFIEGLYMDLRTGKGISERSLQVLHDIAGVSYLATVNLHQKQVEKDKDASFEKSYHASQQQQRK